MVGYLESVSIKYVIATMNSPTTYLIFQDNQISFTQHISRATKTVGKQTAKVIRDEFYTYTGRTDIELVVLPIRVSYEILKEEIIEDENNELLS